MAKPLKQYEVTARMRNKVRAWLFILQREWTAYWSHCWYCGRMGAHVSSIAYPKRLCGSCNTAMCRRVEFRKMFY